MSCWVGKTGQSAVLMQQQVRPRVSCKAERNDGTSPGRQQVGGQQQANMRCGGSPHLNLTLAGRPGPPMAQGTGLRVWLVSSTGLPSFTTGCPDLSRWDKPGGRGIDTSKNARGARTPCQS